MRTRPVGQHVEQEASQELDRIERHEFRAGAMRVVFPVEADATVFERTQTMVGDGDAVRVAGQILQHAARSAEGRFDVNHPIDISGLIAQSLERDRVRRVVSARRETAERLFETRGVAFAESTFGSDD